MCSILLSGDFSFSFWAASPPWLFMAFAGLLCVGVYLSLALLEQLSLKRSCYSVPLDGTGSHDFYFCNLPPLVSLAAIRQYRHTVWGRVSFCPHLNGDPGPPQVPPPHVPQLGISRRGKQWLYCTLSRFRDNVLLNLTPRGTGGGFWEFKEAAGPCGSMSLKHLPPNSGQPQQNPCAVSLA